MNNVIYDQTALKRYDEIDVLGALVNFSSQQDYYNQLTDFAEHSVHYLDQYNAGQIVNDIETLAGFLSDLNELRKNFIALGMIDAVRNLIHLESAAVDKQLAVLERELFDFYTKMEKITSIIVSAQSTAEIAPAPSEKPIIMAVDDMPALLSSVVQMLQPQYTVVAVTNATAALKAIERQTPSLFLLDIEMPQMNGYELAAAIRENERFKNTPIIFITAKGTRDDVILAILHGGNDYIIKPVDKDMLLSKIEKLV